MRTNPPSARRRTTSVTDHVGRSTVSTEATSVPARLTATLRTAPVTSDFTAPLADTTRICADGSVSPPVKALEIVKTTQLDPAGWMLRAPFTDVGSATDVVGVTSHVVVPRRSTRGVTEIAAPAAAAVRGSGP